MRIQKLKTKLLVSLIGVGMIPMLLMGIVIYYSAGSALETQAFNQLESVRNLKKHEIERYFKTIENQVLTYAEDIMIIEAVKDFKQAFKSLPEELGVSQIQLKEMRAKVKNYYVNEFGKKFQNDTGEQANIESILPKSPSSIISQYQYIASNPNPLGAKDSLKYASDASSYSSFHKKYHHTIRDYQQKFGYYDIFLIDAKSGDIVYSVFKELDYATSLNTGPYRNTNFAQAFRAAVESGKPTFSYMTDFAHYLPSYNAPAAFIAAPIVDGKTVEGVMVFQMPLDRIADIMNDSSGMGESGETYLVGPDKLMRSQSRFATENTILKSAVDTASVDAVLSGIEGKSIIKDYRNVSVLSAYSPISLGNMKWGMVAEIDKSEALSPKYALLFYAAGLTLLTAILASIYGSYFARNVMKILGAEPKELEGVAKSIAAGDLKVQLNHVNSPDSVYASMVEMRNKLSSAIEDDIQPMITAAGRGDLNKTIEISDKEGFYRDLVVGINSLVSVNKSVIEDALRVFDALSQGRLDQGINNNYEGKFCELKEGANNTVEKLRQVIQEDIQQLVNSAARGDLSQRIELSDKQGFFRQMSESINLLVESVTDIFDETSGVLNHMAQGDLSGQIGKNYYGQFDQLKRNVNDTLKHLRSTIDQLHTASDEITSAATGLYEGSKELTSRTESQATALTQTASASEELTTTVAENASNASSAEAMLIEAKKVAAQGGDTMRRTANAMEEINHASAKIGAIISVIDEIAFQTNLLALNAAVEAARAGDEGKGFAVVASEVRMLAQRSSGAAQEIKVLIEDSANKVGDGVGLMTESSANQSEIISSIERISEIISNIASVSQEQSIGIGEVNTAMISMDNVTQHNSELAVNTAKASEALSVQSEQMKSLISFFKTSKTSKAA